MIELVLGGPWILNFTFDFIGWELTLESHAQLADDGTLNLATMCRID